MTGPHGQPVAGAQVTRPGQPSTAQLGFGCAGLFGLPSKRDRRSVLEAAYEAGIRHFDVAPMYGLGLAEAELGEFAKKHDDICIATKFGIRPTTVGRAASAVQAPVRRILRRSPGLKATVKQSGVKRGAGVVGTLLYSGRDYSIENAARSLARSLKVLAVERIDYFFLHEPTGIVPADHCALADYLDIQRDRGVIRYWGPAGELSSPDGELRRLTGRASAVQMPYDFVDGHRGPRPDELRPTNTFGFVTAALPIAVAVLTRNPLLRSRCSELLDVDLGDRREVFTLLLRDALSQNPNGAVLLSSTSVEHVRTACAAAAAPAAGADEVIGAIRHECHGAGALT